MKHEFKVTKSKEQTVYTLESATGGSTSAGSIASVSLPLGGMQRRPKDSIFAQEAKKDEPPKPRNFVAKNAKMGGAGQHTDKKKAAKQGIVKHKKPLAESYAEQLARQVFDSNPNIKDENEVLDAAWPIVVKDLGNKRAMSMFNYDEDFSSDLVSVYDWLQKDQQGVAEDFNGEYDDEAGMAHSNLLTSARAVIGLLKTIDNRDNLPEWAQEKIAKAEMMLVTVWDYLQSQKQMGNDPQVDMEEGLGKMRGNPGAYNADVRASQSGMNNRPHDHRGLGQELGHETNNYAVAIDGKTWKVFADKRQADNIARSLQAKGKNATVQLTGHNPSESIEERTEVKDKSGKVVSWKDETPWHKAEKNKQGQLKDPRGKVTNLSDKARRETEKNVEEDDSALQAFLSKGGKVDKLPYKEPKTKDKANWGSKHIGTGKGGKAQNVSGKGANTRTGNKPVVSVEDAYMMELANMVAEKLNPSDPTDVWVQDFQKADPNKYHQFKNKNPAKKAQMAVAAHYAANEPSKKK